MNASCKPRLSLHPGKEHCGRAIAMIKGGKLDGEIVYIREDPKKSKASNKHGQPLSEIIGCDKIYEMFNKIRTGKEKKNYGKRQLSDDDLDLFMDSIDNNDATILDKAKNKDILQKMYDEITKDDKNSFDREISLMDGELSPFPRVKKSYLKKGKKVIIKPWRECLYIGGRSGSGKTYYYIQYIKIWRKLFPKSPMYIFTRIKDPNDVDIQKLEKLGVKRIKIDQHLIDDPMDIKEISGPELHKDVKPTSLCIFDDIDNIQDKKIQNEIYRIQNELLEIGRHDEVYVISTAHKMMDYKRTRTLLNEATSMTLFPRSGTQYHVKRLLKVYGDGGKEDINKIIKLPSRWITLYNDAPQFVLYQHGVYLT